MEKENKTDIQESTDDFQESPNNFFLYFKIVVDIVLCIATVGLVIWLLPKFLWFFMPFVIAFIVASVINPIVGFLERKVKIIRKHSSVIMIILLIAIIVSVIYFLVSLIFKEVSSLVNELPAIIDGIKLGAEELLGYIDNYISILPDFISEFITAVINSITSMESIKIELPNLEEAGDYLGKAVNLLFLIVITILASYFLVAEKISITEFVDKRAPEFFRESYQLLTKSLKTAVGGYFKVQFKLMILIMAIMFVAFMIFDVKYAFLIAFITAFLDLLPVLGTGTILGPWAVYEILTKDYINGILLIVLYIVCLLVKQLLQPKMVGDSMGMNPLFTLVCMYIGYRINGFLGLIIAIPIGLFTLTLYKAGAFNKLIRGVKILYKGLREFRKY